MTVLRRNLQRAVAFSLIILVASGISGLLYYLKMQQNEQTFNRLQMQEIKRVEQSILQTLQRINTTATYLVKHDACQRFPDSNNCQTLIKDRLNFIKNDRELRSLAFDSVTTLHCDAKADSADLGCKTLNKDVPVAVKMDKDTEFYIPLKQSIPTNNNIDNLSDTKTTNAPQTQNNAGLYKLSFSLKSNDLLLSSNNNFPYTLIAKESGEIVAQYQNLKRNLNMPALELQQISKSILNPENDMRGSRILDTNINNASVRLFVVPLDIEQVTDGDTLFLIGLIPNAQVTDSKLQISSTTLMWLILATLFLMALTPLLKVRFVNPGYSFTKNDKSQIAFGIIMAFAILTIAINQHLFYSYIHDTKKSQTKHLFSQLQSDFTSELSAALEQLNTLSSDLNNNRKHAFYDAVNGASKLNKETEIFDAYNKVSCSLKAYMTGMHSGNPNEKAEQSSPECSIYDNTSEYSRLKFGKQTNFMEMAGVLDNQKFLSPFYPVFYASDKLFIDIGQPLNLSSRRYADVAVNKTFWTLEHSDTSRQASEHVDSFFIQRIHNIEDARRISMLTVPFTSNNEDESVAVISSLRFNSLLDATLPMGFSYAVIDENGKALFHSDDDLSLVEDFIYETNNNKELITATKLGIEPSTRHQMEFEYKGVDHFAIVGSMLKQQNTVPWRLIVFYDETELAMNNMILVFAAVFLFLVLMLPMFFTLRYFCEQKFFQELLYFQPTKRYRYMAWSVLLFVAYIVLIFSIGLLNELTERLTAWLILCLGVISFLHRRLKIDMRPYHWLRLPQTSLLMFIGVFLLLDRSLSHDIALPFVTTNWVFFIAGVIGFIGVYVYLTVQRYSKHKRQVTLNDCLVKPRKYVSEQRFSRGYIAYLTTLLIIVSTAPAVMISHSTNGYLLQRQADLQKLYAEQQLQNQQAQYADYVNKISVSLDSTTQTLINNKTAQDILSYHYPDEIPIERETSFVHKLNTHTDNWIFLPDSTIAQKKSDTSITDTFIDHLFALAEFQNDYGTMLSLLAKRQLEDAMSIQDRLIYRPDNFMMAASQNNTGFILLANFLLFLLMFMVTKRIIAIRLLGEHIAEHFRVIRPCDNELRGDAKFPILSRVREDKTTNAVLLLNATKSLLETACKHCNLSLYANKIHHVSDCLERSNELFLFYSEIMQAHEQGNESRIFVAIEGLETLSQDKQQRQTALSLLRTLHKDPAIVVLLVADTSPLFRLLNHGAYLPDEQDNANLSIDETSAWTKIFNDFEKEYLWLPQQKRQLKNPLDLDKAVAYEAKGWHEMQAIKEKFESYHRRVKQQNPDDGLDKYWHIEQIIEFFLVQAGPFYRKQWELCTREEKTALWQLANNASLNPANTGVVEHLVRRGYIYRDKGWHIINESFRRFVLSAESEQRIEKWLSSHNEGFWHILRIPIFIIFIVLVVVMYYSSGESLTSFISVATGTLGLIPLVLKNVNLVKSTGLPETD